MNELSSLLNTIEIIRNRKNNIELLLQKKEDLPIMIHVIGETHSDKQAYICTALRQIETFEKLGVQHNRMFIIYGDAVPSEKKCSHPHGSLKMAPHHKGKWFPDDVKIRYVDNKKENQFIEILYNILKNECTEITPIIFGYDGHGALKCLKNGKFTVYGNQTMRASTIRRIFEKANRHKNNKLLLWTQCGSFDFTKKISKKLPGFHICSTTKPNTPGYGSSIMREFSYKILGLRFGTFIETYNKSPLGKDITFDTYNTIFYSVFADKDCTGILVKDCVIPPPNIKILDYLHLKINENQ